MSRPIDFLCFTILAILVALLANHLFPGHCTSRELGLYWLGWIWGTTGMGFVWWTASRDRR